MTELLEQAIALLKKLPLSEQERIAQIILTEVETQKVNSVGSSEEVSLKDQPFVGMWKDRGEMQNSSNWVRQLRLEQWKRYNG